MKKLLLSAFVGVLFQVPSPSVMANNAIDVGVKVNTEHQISAKQALQAKLATIDGFSADFIQRVIDSEGQVIANGEGQLTVEKPNKVNWHTTSPDETLIIANGETLWFYDPFIEQVSVYDFEQALANTPILLLSSNNETLWDGYRVIQVESSFVIESLDEQSHVKSLQLKFDNERLDQLLIFDATGQVSEITLAMRGSSASKATIYDFSIPEGTHIDDQRQ